ncbi:cholest-4-en-3-one 26-monooxygenase [Sinobacterium caligoides]|uniref:Cholest-4-en-3-one 26-monooxygenase n=1 Tax=Sinobacterium caligoides TaxID=933926 RepID=A0A3N2DQ16_9GAMM|nr:cytochrome P450 [Sinobacterium caligoides]ROS01921.1 cholest-4-en-3-one 26-monooxygenase [Sinobacterium caligoides]
MNTCPFSNALDPETFAEGMPYQELKEIRAAGPILRMEDPITDIPYWLVTQRKELDFVSKNPKLFSSAENLAFPMEMDDDIKFMLQQQIINMDPPNHQKYRKIIRRAFTPAAVDSYEPAFRAHAERILDAVTNNGECEFVEDVAAELPLIAILDLLGVPADDREDFFHWTNTMIFADDPDMSTSREEGQIAAFEVITYANNLAEQHKINPKNDLVGALLDGAVAGEALSQEEFCWFFVLLLVGGNESTRTVTAQGMRLLMENPLQLQYLVDNPDKIAGATEEILRYSTAFITMRRTAMEDIELGGQLIKQGDKVILHYHSVNHDENIFGSDACEFDVTRPERMPDLYNQHRSFGIGQHFCIGSHLARLELRVMFEAIIPRLRNPRLKSKPKFVRSYFVNAMKEMQISFDTNGSAKLRADT